MGVGRALVCDQQGELPVACCRSIPFEAAMLQRSHLSSLDVIKVAGCLLPAVLRCGVCGVRWDGSWPLSCAHQPSAASEAAPALWSPVIALHLPWELYVCFVARLGVGCDES